MSGPRQVLPPAGDGIVIVIFACIFRPIRDKTLDSRCAMSSPPFRLARLVVDPGAAGTEGSYGVAPQCCPEASLEAKVPPRRTRLAELDQHVHCSVIGTCLTTHELRRLIP